MPGLGDDKPGQPAGAGRFRASHADRELVIDALGDAFVQGRLSRDEFDSRVGQAFAARTHADLAPLTADLPPVPPESRGKPSWRPEDTTPGNSARVIAAATVLTGGAWAGALLSGTVSQLPGGVALTLTFVWLGIVCLCGSVLLEYQLDKRRRRQLRSGPGDAGQPPGGGPSSERTLAADPATWLGPGEPGQHVVEASRRAVARRPQLLAPRLSPS
jgi:hypothetical protein